MANDSTVKAGSWGARTVEKIIRIQETAGRLRHPALLPGRLGGRAHHRSDRHVPRAPPRGAHLPQPGAAVGRGAADLPAVRSVGGGRRLHPGVLRRRVHGRQERVDVPRLAAHGGDGDRREGDAGGDGRRAHALRGLGLRRSAGGRRARLPRGGARLPGLPAPARRRAGAAPPAARRGRRRRARKRDRRRSCPPTRTRPSTSHDVIDALVDEGSFFELKKLFAREIVTGFARLDGRAVGIVASQPKWKGGVLFVDSADKAARFIWLCDAFGVPLLFLADVPGFMIGKAVERAGHHPPRRQDDLGGGRRDRAEDLRRAAQGLRRRPVRDVRSRLRARRHDRAAAGDDRGDGRRGGGQRRLRQQDRGEARGRAGRLRRGAARASTARTSTS